MDKGLVFVAYFLGFQVLTPKQRAILLLVFENWNVLALLPTGNGKTYAFWGIAVLVDFLFNGDPRST